jgi:hypothetical protein
VQGSAGWVILKNTRRASCLILPEHAKFSLRKNKRVQTIINKNLAGPIKKENPLTIRNCQGVSEEYHNERFMGLNAIEIQQP